jgi:predicted hotdog family 3-hydroxylacyl-ACP dehydratase
MIDELLHSDDKISRSRFLVKPDNIFLENGCLQEAALLENIAQTAAARAGYTATSNNEPVRLGYIGAVKNFEVFQLPKTADLLETAIEIANQIFDVTLIRGSIHCKGQLLASCEMKIFIINHKQQ